MNEISARESNTWLGFSDFERNRGFSLNEIGFLKGITELVIRLAGCLHTSRIIADFVKDSVKSTYLMKGVFIVFVSKPCAQQNSRKSSIIHLLPSARAFPGRFVTIRKDRSANLWIISGLHCKGMYFLWPDNGFRTVRPVISPDIPWYPVISRDVP